jgi:hypothetical protein
VRDRYYVSQAVLQKREDEAGSIARIAAPDIEELVIAALRHQLEEIDRQVFPGQTSPLRESQKHGDDRLRVTVAAHERVRYGAMFTTHRKRLRHGYGHG